VLEGDGDIEVHRVAGIEQASAGDVTFLANPKYARALATTGASAVILGPGAPQARCPVLRAINPYQAFASAVSVFNPPPAPPAGIHPLAWVPPETVIGSDVSIGPFVWIGQDVTIGSRVTIRPNVCIASGVSLGDDCLVHSLVAINEGCVIGKRVVIQSGAVIGSDGFGFVRLADGRHQKIPQVAGVVIEDDVEIGANTTIDRPAVGETRIRAGAKLDNLVQVAHGVTIGRNTMLAAQVGIAGSTAIGDDVVLAGQVGIAGHVVLGNGVVATGKTGITNSLQRGAFVSGYPAVENREWLRSSALIRKLPALRRTVIELERRIAELERQLAVVPGGGDEP
jgi:UDP-3-O-[3-hydroxymyristoyl] glucosamine N-acyltransferase